MVSAGHGYFHRGGGTTQGLLATITQWARERLSVSSTGNCCFLRSAVDFARAAAR